MAGPTRLELATSGVTGRRSNQLNYDPAQVVRGHTLQRKRACAEEINYRVDCSANASRCGIIDSGTGG